MQRITVKVERPFLFGGKVREVGERVNLDAPTARDLVNRKRASIPSDDEQAAPSKTPTQAPARPGKARRG